MSRSSGSMRYAARFLAEPAGLFIPFFVLGDPDFPTSARLLRAAIEAGADALEVGIPFSDPVADGATIQRAILRAHAAGATPARCFALLAELRAADARVPVGLLVYANIVVHRTMDRFYDEARSAGVDSVLIADVPVREAEPFCAAARAHDVAPILIAPPNAPESTLVRLAALSDGYTYCVARSGVTGVDEEINLSHGRLFATLRAHGAPPPVLGFGISKPEHVRAARAAGAAGVISGSAIAARIEASNGDAETAIASVCSFVRAMKAATREPLKATGATPRGESRGRGG